jgi:hypothetical protein
MDSIASPKVKTTEGEGVGARSLIRNTSGVEGHAGVPRWGLGRLISNLIIHMDLHKLNNKLINAELEHFGAWMSHEQARTNHKQTWTHKIHHGLDLGEATTFPLIVYFLFSHGTITQMSFCLGIPK